jgi:hypothetical protein
MVQIQKQICKQKEKLKYSSFILSISVFNKLRIERDILISYQKNFFIAYPLVNFLNTVVLQLFGLWPIGDRVLESKKQNSPKDEF